LVKEFVGRRHVLVRVAVQQVDAQRAMPLGLIRGKAVVRRFVIGAAVAFFHLEQEDVDRCSARIARLAHRMREAHHLGEDASPHHQLRGHVLDLVGHAVAVGIAGVGQCVLSIQRVEDAELIAHMHAIEPGKVCTARCAAFFRACSLRCGRKGGNEHGADEEKGFFPASVPRNSTRTPPFAERRGGGISRVFHCVFSMPPAGKSGASPSRARGSRVARLCVGRFRNLASAEFCATSMDRIRSRAHPPSLRRSGFF